MTIQWFLSRTVRQTTEMCRQMKRILNEQRDLLSAEAISQIEAARQQALETIRRNPKKEALRAEMRNMEEAANRWFKPYWQPAVRENVKELLVAIVTILAFTTFFLQLTKIPTGSMQPTLFGVTHQDLRGTDFEMPNFLSRMAAYWLKGISYKQLIAPYDGQVRQVEPLKTVFPFVKKQRILYNNEWLTLWLAPERFDEWCQPVLGKHFRKGEEIIKMKVVSGDHLLVDRFTYNFRKPNRGEIIVFKTRGIRALNQNQLYIKRLVALPGEEVRISNDGHLIINDTELSASTRHFEGVYTFDDPLKVEHPYLGHANEVHARSILQRYVEAGLMSPHDANLRSGVAPVFPDENATFKVGPRHYLAMGDNTLNSLDSRSWGDFPQENVIGRCWFVYWPFTDRFGWGYR